MEVQAYDIIVELISQSHQFGESVADSIELWISVSFAVIGAAYFAPDRMNPLVATFLVAIYMAFTAHTFASTSADIRASQAATSRLSTITTSSKLSVETPTRFLTSRTLALTVETTATSLQAKLSRTNRTFIIRTTDLSATV